MTHEARIEPVPVVEQQFSHAQVLGHDVELPVCSVFVCHNCVVLCSTGANLQLFSDILFIFIQKLQNMKQLVSGMTFSPGPPDYEINLNMAARLGEYGKLLLNLYTVLE